MEIEYDEILLSSNNVIIVKVYFFSFEMRIE
jgi:hypothetical protein